jgi:glycosyltransferase involved in cell wall biosynthesis
VAGTGSIRVVNLVPDPRVGGPQRRIALLAAALQPLGYETMVVIPPGPAVEFFEKRGLECVPFRFPRPRRSHWTSSTLRLGGGYAFDVLRLASLLRNLRADILHCNGAITVIGPPAGYLAGSAVVWHFNDTQVPRAVYRLLMMSLGHLADGIVVASQAVAHHALPSGVPHVVLPPPVDALRLRPSGEGGGRMVLLSGLGLDPKAPTVVTVGHLNAIKGHSYLLDAAALMRDRGLQVLFVGDRVDETVASRLEAQILQKGLRDRVRLVGGTEDIEPFLSAADAFVLPSLKEGMPTALLEAMAAGLPVVSTNVGGVSEAIEDGVSGLLAPPGDPESLARQIARMLDDPAASARMAQRARSVAAEGFSTAAIAARLACVYERALARR